MKQRMQRRRRLTHIQRLERLQRLEKRLADEAKRLHEQADLLPPGPLREQVLMKARQAETGSHVSELLRSPGLRSPDQKQNWIPHIFLVWHSEVRSMPRYYFDLMHGEAFVKVKDEEGMELPDIGSAQIEATESLTDMVKDIVTRETNRVGYPMSIEVRDSEGSLFLLSFTFSSKHWWAA
jgi:hypothetical protein